MLGFARSASPPRAAALPTLAAASALPLDLPEIVSDEPMRRCPSRRATWWPTAGCRNFWSTFGGRNNRASSS